MCKTYMLLYVVCTNKGTRLKCSENAFISGTAQTEVAALLYVSPVFSSTYHPLYKHCIHIHLALLLLATGIMTICRAQHAIQCRYISSVLFVFTYTPK